VTKVQQFTSGDKSTHKSQHSNYSATLTILLLLQKQQSTGGIIQPAATKTGKQLAGTKVARITAQ